MHGVNFTAETFISKIKVQYGKEIAFFQQFTLIFYCNYDFQSRSDSNHPATVIISFESPSGSRQWPGYTDEELARPEYDESTETMIIRLDSNQSWADKNTLASLTYGAAFNLHIQLLQVDKNSKLSFKV